MTEPTPDSLDLDLVVKVLSRTLFSPFFLVWIPLLYKAQGAPWDSPIIINSLIYALFVSAFWFLKFTSTIWRNGGNLLRRGPRLDWGEQIVVVTGGSSGIGALLANTFAVRNVTVVVLDLNPIATENYNITYYKCDVSKWEEVEAVSKRIVEEVGHPTILINNAGVVQGKRIIDLNPDDVKQTLDTNLLAHFWTLKAFLPELIKQKTGHIVTVASVVGLVGVSRMADYCASKSGLVSLHESLRYELDKCYLTPNVRTTLVLAGHVQTPLFSHATFPKSWLWRFLCPSLPPHALAKAIIAAVDEHESRLIQLPFYVHFVKFAGILPSWGRDFLQWIAGADNAMRDFVKVSGRRPDEGPPSSKLD